LPSIEASGVLRRDGMYEIHISPPSAPSRIPMPLRPSIETGHAPFWTRTALHRRCRWKPVMQDLLMLALAISLFVLSIGYATICDRL
jgi:hypothetical protein